MHWRGTACLLVALAVGTAVGAGCSSGGGAGQAFTPVAGSDGPYCATYRAWKVYELDHGEAFDQSSPAALRVFWSAYLASEETLLRQAPRQIRAAVEVKVRFVRTRLAPVLEKYGFDLERLRREGAPAERAAVFQGPPPAVQRAQAAQYAFEDRACGTQPAPAAADVVFVSESSSEAYCGALAGFDDALGAIASSRFDPGIMRSVVTGDRFARLLDRLEGEAPPAIAHDVEAEADWYRARWRDVVSTYGYDLRKIYVDATPEDLAVFNRTHPDVVEHASRITAYAEQVCDG